MAALTSERNTTQLRGDMRVELLAAAVKVWKGGLLMRNAAGFVTRGATAPGCVGIGRAEATVDNSAGAAGAAVVSCRSGIFGFANSGAGDAITQADVGQLCYIVDDQTVAKTDGSASRSPAGIVDSIADGTVWVRFDEAVTRGAM